MVSEVLEAPKNGVILNSELNSHFNGFGTDIFRASKELALLKIVRKFTDKFINRLPHP